MTGFELRLWRRGFNWTQERAAEELGVSLRTYKTYEKKGPSKLVILATRGLDSLSSKVSDGRPKNLGAHF